MLSSLHSRVVENAEQFRQEFLNGQPFRHVVMEPFLNAESCAQLTAEFPPFDQKHAWNEHGELGRRAVHSDLARLGPAYAQLDRLMSVPIANRAVIFETTEASWHGFRRIRIPEGKSTSRRSIAVYFYSKDRPVEAAAPSHATFYYPRPLPDHLRPGYTLEEKDVGELRDLLARRDAQLRFLYKRELEFSESLNHSAKAIAGLNQTVASVLGSVSFKLGRALTWPVRRLKSPAGK